MCNISYLINILYLYIQVYITLLNELFKYLNNSDT